MADDGMHPIVKIGIVGGLGYLAYKLVSSLGVGAGSGKACAAPKRPKDTAPIEIFVRPKDNAPDGVPDTTQIRMDGQVVTVDQVVARVFTGGRDDVLVTISGAARHGDVVDILQSLRASGLKVTTIYNQISNQEPAPPATP